MELKDNETLTAPDFSFTATAAAVRKTAAALKACPPPPDTPAWIGEAVIFALLTEFEGYTYETSLTLIDNQFYNFLIHQLWIEFTEWQRRG